MLILLMKKKLYFYSINCEHLNYNHVKVFLDIHHSFILSRWVSDDWGECSRSCGGGIKSRQVKCMSLTASGDLLFPNYECVTSSKPATTQQCNSDVICPPQWHTGPWSKVCNY